MDFDITEKEKVYQPSGSTQVLKNNIFDFKLQTHKDSDGTVWIDDVDVLDDDTDPITFDETRDRVVFAVLRQRGQDPIAPKEGVQWSEALLGEIPPALLMAQCVEAAKNESTLVSVDFSTVTDSSGNQTLAVTFSQISSSELTSIMGV